MVFTPQFLDELRARTELSQVVGRRVRLIQKGANHSGLCPFHNEKTPSFTVSNEKGFFHCFGCGAHGDVIGFVMRDEGLPFPEAVEKLATEVGLEIPRGNTQDIALRKSQISLYSILEEATQFFEQELAKSSGDRAQKYIKGRGLFSKTVAQFRLGYAPDSRNSLKSALLKANISESMLITAGLLVAGESGGKSYDRFRDRIIFPIHDRRGRVIAFGGRTLGNSPAKYLNSPDTPVFNKSAVLYGMHMARPAARKSSRLILVEGYMDVIALHQGGLLETTAPLGTALTELQMEEMWRVADEPILCFDGDVAGETAALRAAERALPRLKSGKSLRFASLPKDQDPDSIIGAGGKVAIESVLLGTKTLSEQLWKLAGGDSEKLETPEKQAAINRRLNIYIEKITDKDLRFYYNQYFRRRLFKETSKRSGGNQFKRQRSKSFSKNEKIMPQYSLREHTDGSSGRRERSILQTLVNFPKLIPEFHEEIERLPLRVTRYQVVRDTILSADVDGVDLNKLKISYILTQAGLEKILDELVGVDVSYLDWAACSDDASLKDARMQLRHTLDLHHRLIEMKKFSEAAEKALAADMSEKNLERLAESMRAVDESPGIEVEMTGYREDSEEE